MMNYKGIGIVFMKGEGVSSPFFFIPLCKVFIDKPRCF